MPELPAQSIDLAAAVEAAPAEAVTAVTAEAGYETVHSSPAGWLPDADVNDRESAAVPPAGTVAEDKARVSDWQMAALTDRSSMRATAAYREVCWNMRICKHLTGCATRFRLVRLTWYGL